MVTLTDLHEIRESVFEISRDFRSDMRVPARVIINRSFLEAIIADRSLDQLVNVTTLPGIERYALAMPDIHQGYGFPVGGVAAIRAWDGVISPGGIGYDINCGVRMLLSPSSLDEVREYLEKLATQIQRDVPSGVGRGGFYPLESGDMDKVLNNGIRWAKKRGFASAADEEVIEEHGYFHGANADYVSDDAKRRGRDQLGTIGAGNHFVELQSVARIFDSAIASAYGLFEHQFTVMIHTGSRGLGHQTCTDYVREMNRMMARYTIELPDRELACAPFRSEEGQRYFGAMAAAANFAWVNRQVITHQIRNAFTEVLGGHAGDHLRLLYDVSHNIAKREEYFGADCIVHRKGATRAFGPGREEVPLSYREVGQPVLIPGSMGTSSYILCGLAGSEASFGSCCHGAGRRLSRTKARQSIDFNQLMKELEHRGVIVRGGSSGGLLEEAPDAYKDVDQVVATVERTGIARVVAQLSPVAVIKG